jgi:hypothetical protein
MVYYLPSVKCCINAETLVVYKLTKEGFKQKWKHLDSCSDAWFSRLNDYDFGTIENLLNNR